MRRIFLSIGLVLLLCACNTAADNSPGVEIAGNDSFRQWRLPARLREISGLALTQDERLLAITDEEAIVYELDYESGAIIKAFALGEPTKRGDFEGIAVVGQTVWLLTSDGVLFATNEGSDGERVTYSQYDTGLGDYCELEGLGQDAAKALLLLACKETKSKSDPLKIFQVSVAAARPALSAEIVVVHAEIADKIDKKHVRPSAIAIDPKSANFMLLAANHQALITLSSEGDIIDAIILPGNDRHRQAEGIEITGAGHLLIADEGGNGHARLAVYRSANSVWEREEQE